MNLFVGTSETFSSFIALCRSAYYSKWNFLIKNWQDMVPRYQFTRCQCLLLPSFLSFILSFMTFFLTENREATCATQGQSTSTNKFSSIRQLIYNIIHKYNSSLLCVSSFRLNCCTELLTLLLLESWKIKRKQYSISNTLHFRKIKDNSNKDTCFPKVRLLLSKKIVLFPQ